MKDLLPFIIAGITAGSVYGLAGVGLVLTYKTSGVFNFAHGALGTIAAFAFYFLHIQHGVPWPIAAVVCVVVLGPASGLLFESFAGRLSKTSLALAIVATVGALLIVEASTALIYGSGTHVLPPYLPTNTFRLLGVNVGYDKLIITILSLVMTAALYVFFRTARMGKAMRAVVDEADLLDLAGTNPVNVRRWAWTIGCSFATLSGLLLAPSVSVDPVTLTLLVVQAFGAAAIGGFSSLPITWAGGLVIGITSSVLTKYISSTVIVSGIPASLPFIVLFLVTLVYPRAKLAFKPASDAKPHAVWRLPDRLQIGMGIAVLALLLAVPAFAGYRLSAWTTSLTSVVLLLSLGLLVRTSGQVSLCHVGFAAIGAAAFSRLSVHVGLPWLLSLLIAGLVAVPIGALLALPAMRLSGLYLALATFGFGILLQDMFYQSPIMFGVTNEGLQMPLPHLGSVNLSSGTGFYYVVLSIVTVTCLVVVALTRSRLGRLLRAIADSATAVAVGGTSVNKSRLLVFCISAYIAAIAGALSGMALGVVTGASYDPFTSLTYLALVLIVAGGEPWYALAGGLGLGLVPAYVRGSSTPLYLQLLFGGAAILAALGLAARLPLAIRAALDRLGGRKEAVKKVEQPISTRQRRAADVDLTVRGLSVTFGGLFAVKDLSLKASAGRITGLIGPNGSGKTTTLNACSGLVKPRRGSIALGSHDLTGLSSAQRAQRGLGRTFQIMQLYDSFTVRDNVALGCEAYQAGSRIAGQLFGRREERALAADSTTATLELCNLKGLAVTQVASLSTGQRRLVELARCLAGPFDFLLLDEPSSGLDRVETARFGEILREVVATRGVGVLLVEHDMSLVLDICDDIFVMESGTLLFHGSPAEVRASSEVQDAYLGTDVHHTDTGGPQAAVATIGDES